MHARAQPHIASRVDHQTVRGDQKHFKENKQVKEVTGQKRAHDAHKLELEQRMEMPPPIIPSRSDGVEQHKEAQHRGQQHHHRGQPVRDQHNAKRCRPITQLIKRDCAVRGLPRKPGSNHDQRQNTRDAEHPLDADMIPRRKHDERCKDGGQNDGKNDPMGHDASPALVSAGSTGSFTLSSSAPR